MSVRGDQPLLGVLVEEDGYQVVRYFADDIPGIGGSGDHGIADARSLAGAWSDLDWEQTVAALDRIRHATQPVP